MIDVSDSLSSQVDDVRQRVRRSKEKPLTEDLDDWKDDLKTRAVVIVRAEQILYLVY